MSNSMSDIYGAMFQKHINQPSPIYDQQDTSQASFPPTNISESVINAFTKKTNRNTGSNTALLNSLLQIKESIDIDPRSAKNILEKLITEIQK